MIKIEIVRTVNNVVLDDYHIDVNGREFCSYFPYKWITDGKQGAYVNDSTIHNAAKLMVAAPELLDMLKQLVIDAPEGSIKEQAVELITRLES